MSNGHAPSGPPVRVVSSTDRERHHRDCPKWTRGLEELEPYADGLDAQLKAAQANAPDAQGYQQINSPARPG
jgi:hypothetical protein